MKLFTYKTVELKGPITELGLKAYGQKGFELCGCIKQSEDKYIYYFKREV